MTALPKPFLEAVDAIEVELKAAGVGTWVLVALIGEGAHVINAGCSCFTCTGRVLASVSNVLHEDREEATREKVRSAH